MTADRTTADAKKSAPRDFARLPRTHERSKPAFSRLEREAIRNGSDAAAISWKHGFLSYVTPGPPVWTGQVDL